MKYSRLITLAVLMLLLPACALAQPPTEPVIDQVFTTPAPLITILPYESPTPTIPGSTPSSAPVMAQAIGDINVRSGPGLDQTVVGTLANGETVLVVGRSDVLPWYRVAWADGPGGQAWVYKDVVTIVGDLSTVPLAAITADPSGATLTPIPTNPPVATQPGQAPIATPFGCQKPSDDYTIVSVGDAMIINRRTYDMLAHAQELYGGAHNFLRSITQGSYSPGVDASFGTHDGGGALDMSVRDASTYAVLTAELPAFILALREAGFAAWVREENELNPGSPIHIHMIAIGDKDLSTAARRQIDGVEGYFRGFNGLPVDPPAADKWGPPLLCPWMSDLGYTDLRASP